MAWNKRIKEQPVALCSVAATLTTGHHLSVVGEDSRSYRLWHWQPVCLRPHAICHQFLCTDSARSGTAPCARTVWVWLCTPNGVPRCRRRRQAALYAANAGGTSHRPQTGSASKVFYVAVCEPVIVVRMSRRLLSWSKTRMISFLSLYPIQQCHVCLPSIAAQLSLKLLQFAWYTTQ